MGKNVEIETYVFCEYGLIKYVLSITYIPVFCLGVGEGSGREDLNKASEWHKRQVCIWIKSNEYD